MARSTMVICAFVTALLTTLGVAQEPDPQQEWARSAKLTISPVPEVPKTEAECINPNVFGREVGYLEHWQFYVLKVVDDTNLLVVMRNSSIPPIWVANHPTKGLVRNEPVRIIGLIEVNSTKYYWEGKRSKLVRVIEFVSADRAKKPIEQLADEKRKAKEEKLFRTWESASGEFSVEALFVDFLGGKVQLKKRDGNLISVDPSLLSFADRNYYRGILLEAKRAKERKERIVFTPTFNRVQPRVSASK